MVRWTFDVIVVTDVQIPPPVKSLGEIQWSQSSFRMPRKTVRVDRHIRRDTLSASGTVQTAG